MIKVLLVDDDVEMLQGLSNIIDWSDYGFSVIGKAENSFEALNIISETMPDVIITDIAMPAMNGLELIREAKKFNPDIKSVIISCHEEFGYAKEAIRLETDEYILEHTLTEDELIQVINSLRNKIQKENEQKEKLYKANREININKYVILEKFYTDIIENNIPYKDEINDMAALCNIVLPSGKFRLISFFVDDLDEVLKHSPIKGYNLFKFCILNIIEESIKDSDCINVFSYHRNGFGLLYWDNMDDMQIKQKMIFMVKEIQKNIQLVLKFQISVCFSSIYEDIFGLKEAVDETQILRCAYFFNGPGAIITAAAQFKNKDSNELYKEFDPEIKRALSMHSQSELIEIIDKLFERIAGGGYTPDSIKALLRRLIVDIEVLFGKYEFNMENFEIKGDTFLTCKRIFREAIEYIFEKSSESMDISSRAEIKRVIEFINTHIDEDITCESMANYVNMNSNYFSRLFKKEIGISFSDYLLNKRMKVATELLNNSNYSIEEVSKAVGIESISYFYRAYKKITGNTPGDIRNKSNISKINIYR